MAPGRPRRPRRPSSSSSQGASNGATRQPLLRRQLSESSLLDYQGLPERLYQAYECLPDFASIAERPLLVDASSGRELAYRQFQSLAAVLATSMAQRLGIGVGDTVAIYSPPSINTPVVSVAAWLVGASAVAIPPETNATELHHLVIHLHSLSTLFVAQAQLPAVARLLALLRVPSHQYPTIVAMDGAGRSPPQPADVNLQDLYSARRGEVPFEREPLTLNGAQDHIAVIYSQFTRSNSGRVTGATTVPMSHATVINHYYNSQQQEPLPNRRARRYPLVYSVLRFHYAYQMHRIIFNIFSRGGAYLVSSSFDPAEFVVLVHDYQLECAELTSSEIRHLIEFLGARDLNERHGPPSGQAPSPSRNLSIAEMLHPLRFIYSDTQEPELARRLGELLPHVELVRARNCSYLEAFERPRR